MIVRETNISSETNIDRERERETDRQTHTRTHTRVEFYQIFASKTPIRTPVGHML